MLVGHFILLLTWAYAHVTYAWVMKSTAWDAFVIYIYIYMCVCVCVFLLIYICMYGYVCMYVKMNIIRYRSIDG